MWEALPLSKFGAWDGQCIWKDKGGNRRCSTTSGPDRIGNRDELLARTRRGETLTQQERIDLAKGLCCLGWHSTEYIAQQICNIWARQPAPEVSLLALQIEVERLRKGYAELLRELEKSAAREKHLRDSSFTTIPKIKGLEFETEGFQKELDRSRNAKEIREKELFTAQLGLVEKRRPKGIIVRLPPTKNENMLLVTPRERIVCVRSDTSVNTNIFGHSLFRNPVFSSSPSRQAPPSQSKAYSATSPHTLVCDPSACLTPARPLDNIFPINSVIDDQVAAKVELKVDVKEEPTLQTTLLLDATLPSLLTTPSSSAQKLTISAISTLYEVTDISSYPPQLPIQLNVTTSEHEHSGLLTQAVPVATYIETLLVNIFHAWSFLCFFSSLAFTQFTSVVFWRGVVAWMQAINGEIAQVMRKYYFNQLEEGEDTLLEEQEAPEAPYPLLQSVVSDPEDREQEKESSGVVYPVAQPVLSDPEDQEQEKEAPKVAYHVPQSLMFDPEGQEQEKEAPEVFDHVPQRLVLGLEDSEQEKKASDAVNPVPLPVVPDPEDREQEKEASQAVYPVPQGLVLDLEDEEQEKEALEATIAVLESAVLDLEDKEADMEVINTTNIDAPHHYNELGKHSWLPAIKTEHIKPTFAAISGRKFAKPRKRTSVKARMKLRETMFPS